MAAKRAYGQGSIYQRADGRWAGSIEIDPGPPRRRKTVYGQTRRDVERKLQEARAQHAQGQPLPDERRTVRQLLEHWLAHVASRPNRSARTPRTYADRCAHLVGPLGHIRLTRLTPKHVDDVLDDLRAQGLADARSMRRATRCAPRSIRASAGAGWCVTWRSSRMPPRASPTKPRP